MATSSSTPASVPACASLSDFDISSAITSTANALADRAGTEVTVTDVVPLPKEDPTGIGGLAFPFVFGGIAVAAILMFVFGSVTAFWPVAAAMALGIAGLALPLAGLQEVFGGKGFTIGAMAMMFLGNPLAGISTTSAWVVAGLALLAIGKYHSARATGGHDVPGSR